MRILKNLVSAVMAGIMISIGGTVFLSSESKLTGAIFFSLGLSVILLQGYALFTGRTAYIFENKPSYLFDLAVMWIGNITGTALIGYIVAYVKPDLAQKATELCNKKLTQSPLQTIVLASLCAVLVYIAVDYFRHNKQNHLVPALLLVFTCIPVFILCGFEHSIADMYYFAVSSDRLLYTASGIVYILLVTVGNIIGSVVFHLARKFCTSADKSVEKK